VGTVTNKVPQLLGHCFIQMLAVLDYNHLAAEGIAHSTTECGHFSPVKSSNALVWRHSNARD